MYIPDLFRDADAERVVAFMRRNAFATVVSVQDGAPVATHLPISLSRTGDSLTLRGHFAKANPQWQALGRTETLVAFTGPHAYISPEHYERWESVPTWNYLSVHAYGQARITDAGEALAGLHQLIEQNHGAYRERWDGLSDRYREGMLRGIVGFELPVTRLEGAAKLSQSKTHGERERIADSLLASRDAAARATGEAMRRHLTDDADGADDEVAAAK